MNRVIKTIRSSSKKGFTLLEVVLSIAIMLILTTMMMRGFSATMNYSYHTSVFASSAADNSQKAYNNIGSISSDANRYATLSKDKELVITENKAVSGGSFTQSIKIDVDRQNKGGERAYNINMGGSSGGATEGKYVTGTNDDGTYTNNRTSYYYLPFENGSGASQGKYRVYYNPSDKKYYWYDTSKTPAEKKGQVNMGTFALPKTT